MDVSVGGEVLATQSRGSWRADKRPGAAAHILVIPEKGDSWGHGT